MLLVGGGANRGLAAAVVVLLLAAMLALCYERRLRRVGRTAEARAAANLSALEGEGFAEEEDVAAERRRVEALGYAGAAESA